MGTRLSYASNSCGRIARCINQKLRLEVSDNQQSKLPFGVLAAAGVLLCGAALLFAFVTAPPPGRPTVFAERRPHPLLPELAEKPRQVVPAEIRANPHVPRLETAKTSPSLVASMPADPAITGALPAAKMSTPLAQPASLSAAPPMQAKAAEAAAAETVAPESATGTFVMPPRIDLVQVAAADAAVEAKISDGAPEAVASRIHRTPDILPSAQIPEIIVKTGRLAEKAQPKPVVPAREKPSERAPAVAARERPNEKASSASTAADQRHAPKPMTLGRALFRGGAVKREAEKAATPRMTASVSARLSAKGYSAKIFGAIARHKRRLGSLSGSATVTFSIGPGGALRGARISRSSGKPQLDQAALATVRSAAPFPPPPPGAKASYAIQIHF